MASCRRISPTCCVPSDAFLEVVEQKKTEQGCFGSEMIFSSDMLISRYFQFDVQDFEEASHQGNPDAVSERKLILDERHSQ